MTSGVAGWTRDSLSNKRLSNIGGEALRLSVRLGAVLNASMGLPIVPPRRRAPKRRAASRVAGRRPCPVADSALERLHAEVLLDGQVAELAPVARLLEAAERRQRIEGPAVDLDLAGADAPGDALGVLGVAGPDAAGQPVDRVVGDLDRFVLGVVGDDRQHRPEDLLLGDRHVVGDVGEDRRLDEVALVEPLGRLLAAGDQPRALLDALADVAAHALALDVGDQRAEARLLLERVAGRELLRDG